MAQRCRIISAPTRGPIILVAMPDRDRMSLDIPVRITSANIRVGGVLGELCSQVQGSLGINSDHYHAIYFDEKSHRRLVGYWC
ncbi:MAG: hypothetical protein QOE39_1917 [Bradyrhizobium sp.]|jgi:hypothetical protein|nr:hypothetical protein [Bradyrhizobium sp.]